MRKTASLTATKKVLTRCVIPVLAATAGVGASLGARSIVSAASVAAPSISDVVAGRTYATQMCSSCHDVTSHINDEFAKARPPSFYAVANASTTTALGLQAFLVTSHEPMPNFIIAQKDRRNVIAYILSLRAEKASQL